MWPNPLEILFGMLYFFYSELSIEESARCSLSLVLYIAVLMSIIKIFQVCTCRIEKKLWISLDVVAWGIQLVQNVLRYQRHNKGYCKRLKWRAF